MAVEFGFGAKQFGLAGTTTVDAHCFGFGVFTHPRWFGAGLAQDLILGRGEKLLPLFFGFGNGVGAIRFRWLVGSKYSHGKTLDPGENQCHRNDEHHYAGD